MTTPTSESGINVPVNEAARMLGISEVMVYNKIKAGILDLAERRPRFLVTVASIERHAKFDRRRGHPHTLDNTRAYFDENWIPEPNSGCWLWTLCENGYGYGVGYFGRTMLAHRIGWTLYRGPIPDGLVLDHICRTRACVNPDHLRLVTLAQNTLENSVSPSAANKSKTHCHRGHPLSGNNLWLEKNGRRHCRKCHAQIEYARKHRIAAP